MSDNTRLNHGDQGDLIATDDIGGVKYQRVKLIHGADGTNDGDVSGGNPLPVGLVDGEVELSDVSIALLGEMLGQVVTQLKVMNLHLAVLTNERFSKKDVENV